MFHLIYISRASHPLREEELLDILNKSRQYNKKHQITGMLLYLNDKFIQVLEGNYSDVQNVFEKIKADQRHHKVTVVLEGNTEHRIFKNWSMGFKKLDEYMFEQLSGYRDLDVFFSKENVTNESPPAMIFLTLFLKRI